MQIETPDASDANTPQLNDTKAQRGISALDNTGELLLALVAAGRPLSLRDLAAAADMPAAKAFPHLVSLLKVGLLSRDDAGLFSAGPLGMANLSDWIVARGRSCFRHCSMTTEPNWYRRAESGTTR